MNHSNGPHESFASRPSVIDVIDIDGSGTALRLEPIRPSGIGFHPTPTRNTTNDTMLPRPRRTQDEIRALLARTNSALDKIVKIRESMEPFVDFKQFEKRGSRTSSFARTTMSRTSSGFEDSARAHLASSYGSATSEDPISDRSTGSTESTSSTSSGALDSSRELSVKEEEDEEQDEDTADTNRTGSRPVPTPTTVTANANTNEEDDDEEEEEDDDTFSSMDELPPHKAARLDRLKHLPVTFHEGLPTAFFMALTRYLYSSVELKTRHSKFNFYKDTFVGADAVRAMVLTGFCEDQAIALRYGNVLVKLGFIEHVSRTDDQLHNHKDHFYRFTRALELEENADTVAADAHRRRLSVTAANYRESVLSRESAASIEYNFTEASDQVHALVTDETLVLVARVLYKVFEHKNKLLFYKGFVGCFLGAEAVNVIRELRLATSLVDAVLVGQALLDDKLIEPITANVATFQDRYVFYRLTRVQSSS